VDAYDRDDVNKIASGTLLTVDNAIDPQTGTSRLKAQFDNSNGMLFPNQFVNCRLLLDMKHGVTIIPSAAIQRGPQGTFVFAAVNGTAQIRPVTVASTEEGDSAVDGLAPGEMVVTDGQEKLQAGMKVDVRTQGGRGGRSRQAGGAGPNGGPRGVAPGMPPQAGPGPAGLRQGAQGPGGMMPGAGPAGGLNSGAPTGGTGPGAAGTSGARGGREHRR
jgi:multidrug efflux system membrane fusion protein